VQQQFEIGAIALRFSQRVGQGQQA
jgi:hypothetical protein